MTDGPKENKQERQRNETKAKEDEKGKKRSEQKKWRLKKLCIKL